VATKTFEIPDKSIVELAVEHVYGLETGWPGVPVDAILHSVPFYR
jgi:hypothetical protein